MRRRISGATFLETVIALALLTAALALISPSLYSAAQQIAAVGRRLLRLQERAAFAEAWVASVRRREEPLWAPAPEEGPTREWSQGTVSPPAMARLEESGGVLRLQGSEPEAALSGVQTWTCVTERDSEGQTWMRLDLVTEEGPWVLKALTAGPHGL